MTRGEIYLVRKPGGRDPRASRPFVVIARQSVIDSALHSVTCAPIYSKHSGLASQVLIGPDEGLDHESSVHCDLLEQIEKSRLRKYLGRLPPAKMQRLNVALAVGVGIT